MTKLTLFLAAILTISTSAFAAADCPLKNLKKSQTLSADKTAFYPEKSRLKNVEINRVEKDHVAQ